jgi:hypothetical protein
VSDHEDEPDGGLQNAATGLDIAGALIALLIGSDPFVASFGVVATLGAAAVTRGRLARKHCRNLDLFNDALIDYMEDNFEALWAAIEERDKAATVAALAVSEAVIAPVDTQASAYGRLLAHGIMDRREDEAEFVIRTIARLGTLEVRALDAFINVQQNTGMTFSASICSEEMLVSSPRNKRAR